MAAPSIHSLSLLEKDVAKPLHLEGDVLLLPDLHVPYFSSQRLHTAVRVAKRLGGCSQVLLLGDTLDLNPGIRLSRSAQ